jgi:hypothetical protein
MSVQHSNLSLLSIHKQNTQLYTKEWQFNNLSNVDLSILVCKAGEREDAEIIEFSFLTECSPKYDAKVVLARVWDRIVSGKLFPCLHSNTPAARPW